MICSKLVGESYNQLSTNLLVVTKSRKPGV